MSSDKVAESKYRTVTVRVPASVANLGSGFDCIGMAVDLWNEVTVTRGDYSIAASGEYASSVPLDESNLLSVGAELVFKHLHQPVPSLAYRCQQNIPVGSGLGSSSAALIAGALAANAFMDNALSSDALLQLVADREGHADNVAPALLGGIVISIYSEARACWLSSHVPMPSGVTAVAFYPAQSINTLQSRSALPVAHSLDDVVYTLGRAMALVNALNAGDTDMLSELTDDKIHQPYRMPTVSGSAEFRRAATDGGALCTFLSGSGPTLVALCSLERAEAVLAAVKSATAENRIAGKAFIVAPSAAGASIISQE